MGLLSDATCGYVLLDSLKALADRLAEEVDDCSEPKALPQLARQYRETLVKINELEGGDDGAGDPIADIVGNHARSGKPTAH